MSEFPLATLLAGVIFQTLRGNKSKLMNIFMFVLIFTGNPLFIDFIETNFRGVKL